MNEDSIGTYYILDLDRTLLDTEKAANVLRDVVARHNPQLAAALAQNVEDYSLHDKSFSMRDFILGQIGEPETAEIEAAFMVAAARQDLLNAGARELMAFIASLEDARFGILTYGSASGQSMKIRAAGLDRVASLVTSIAFKGEQMSAWRGEDGRYHLPEVLGGFTANTIVLIDDKSFSFQGLADDCRGYWVQQPRDAGRESAVPHVVPARGLIEVIDLEMALLSN